jgi:hypothetical protein
MPGGNTRTTGKATAGYTVGSPVLFHGLFGTRLFSDVNVEVFLCDVNHFIKR